GGARGPAVVLQRQRAAAQGVRVRPGHAQRPRDRARTHRPDRVRASDRRALIVAGLRPRERRSFVDWHQRAVIYEAPPELFLDSNGEGVGDFDGLAHALDYLANLGVTVVWLLPFYDSPRKDDGYDVRDYYRVDPRFGSAGDFVRFLKAAEARGMRVIVDITFSHTSDEHPWFQEARADPESTYRDFYIWAEEPIDIEGDENLVGVGKVWTYDRTAKAYYHHNFYPFQPDLNASNPRLRDEMKKI